AAHRAIGDSVPLSIRPEQLLIGSAGDGALPLGRGTVTETSFQGTHLRARVAMGDGSSELLLRAPAGAGLVTGDGVELAVRPADIVMLTRETSTGRRYSARIVEIRLAPPLAFPFQIPAKCGSAITM